MPWAELCLLQGLKKSDNLARLLVYEVTDWLAGSVAVEVVTEQLQT